MIGTGDEHFDADLTHTKLLKLGLVMNVLIPVIFLSVGIFLKSKGVGGNIATGLSTFFWILMAVALSEIPMIHVIRKTTLQARKVYLENHPQAIAGHLLIQWSILVFSVSLSPAIYGLIYYLMGGTLERFVLFVAITLLCFMLFKPKLEELRSFAEKQQSCL